MKLRNKKTGDIGELSVWYRADNKEIKEFGVIKENEKFPTDYKSLAELTEEWEDYEEPKEFWFVDSGGEVEETTYLTENDKANLANLGNYFETKEEAERAVEKLKAWKRLKDKGFGFVGCFKDNTINYEFVERPLDYDEAEEAEQDLAFLFGGEE